MKRLLRDIFQLDLFPSWFPKNGPAPKPKEGPNLVFASRLHKGWRLESKGGHSTLTLPAYMRDDAFDSVRALLRQWCELAQHRKTPEQRAELRELEHRIWQETDNLLLSRGQMPLRHGDRIPPIRPKGHVHDLTPHFQWVNQTYFGGNLHCLVTWSGRYGGLSFHSKRRDPHTGEEVDLVSISRGYDFENCPDYALRGILYHECLHCIIPPEKRNQRRVVHGPVFRRREREFLHYAEWKHWHEEVLPRNVRQLAARQARRKSK
ncbi:MAG TPA: hypothetical protein VLM37_05875 [Fibrobacteraceae bacterium]|nr:hypothetical protein [Fibrobacteraceae bacterium]